MENVFLCVLNAGQIGQVCVCVCRPICQSKLKGRGCLSMFASQRNPIIRDEPFSAIEPHGSALSAAKSLLNRQLPGLKPHLLDSGTSSKHFLTNKNKDVFLGLCICLGFCS